MNSLLWPYRVTLGPLRKGKWLAADDSFGIVMNEGTRELGAEVLRNKIASLRLNRWTVLVIMGVSREHMHCIVVQQPHCDPSGRRSPVTSDSGSRDLNQATRVHPFQNAFGCPPQNGIALGVRNDGNYTGRLKLEETLIYLGR
jgi:hypothetical protein